MGSVLILYCSSLLNTGSFVLLGSVLILYCRSVLNTGYFVRMGSVLILYCRSVLHGVFCSDGECTNSIVGVNFQWGILY